MSDVNTAQVGRPWWIACCAGCLIFLIAIGVTAAIAAHVIPTPHLEGLTNVFKSAKIGT